MDEKPFTWFSMNHRVSSNVCVLHYEIMLGGKKEETFFCYQLKPLDMMTQWVNFALTLLYLSRLENDKKMSW